MADGDVMLDASGNVILDASGNELLDNGTGCASCCGTTCSEAAGGRYVQLFGVLRCWTCSDWGVNWMSGAASISGTWLLPRIGDSHWELTTPYTDIIVHHAGTPPTHCDHSTCDTTHINLRIASNVLSVHLRTPGVATCTCGSLGLNFNSGPHEFQAFYAFSNFSCGFLPRTVNNHGVSSCGSGGTTDRCQGHAASTASFYDGTGTVYF